MLLKCSLLEPESSYKEVHLLDSGDIVVRERQRSPVRCQFQPFRGETWVKKLSCILQHEQTTDEAEDS
jgi:hypothetical protein